MKHRSQSWSALALGAALLLPLAAAAPRKRVPKPPEVQAVKDDPGLRKDAERAWFGGDPTPEYLEWKQGAARREFERWAHTLPGHKGELPAIPGTASTWVNLGPTKSLFSVYSGEAPSYPDVDAGRLSVQGILTHPSNPQIVYVATSGGGLWKTTNADLAASTDWTWTCVSDNLPVATTTGNCSIGAAAMSPADPNTLFLALGDQVDAQGKGLYKSTNGGTSWTELGAIGATTRVMALLVLDANTILVGGNKGVWRSTNGGTSFTQVNLTGSSTNEVIWSIQPVGTSTSNLVATLESASTGAGSFWYSTNGGTTFTVATLDGLATAQNIGRATARGSAASATAVYAMAENRTTQVFAQGVFKSSNGGQSWTFQAAPTATGGLFQPWNNDGDGDQAFYNHCIAVDPANASNVFIATNLSLYRSLDGGSTWAQMTSWNSTNLPYAHADFHTSAWSQTGSKTLFLGNDGGLCVVRDPLRATPPFTTDPNDYATVDLTFVDNRRNRGITSHLVYHVGSTTASTPSDSRHRITLGLQDLSSRIRAEDGGSLQNSGIWNDPTGTGDGFGTVISPTDGNKMMVSSYNTRPRKTTTGGQSSPSWSSATSGIYTGSTCNDPAGAPFHTMLVLGLADATGNTVYTATNNLVWKTTNWASTAWTQLPKATDINNTFGIRHLAASKSNANALAFATGSSVFTSVNGGSTWVRVSNAVTPGSIPGNVGAFSYIWYDTNDANVVYLASVALDATANHLWKSSNGGTSFTAIDVGNGLPFGIPVHCIQNDPSNSSRLLAGTDFGMYISENGGSTWARYGQGLPMVAVRDFYIAPDGSFIRAATFGRGVWEISGGTVPGGPTINTHPASQAVNAGQTATFTVAASGTGTLSYQWSRNGSPIAGATASTYVTSPTTVAANHNDQYRVVVTDGSGNATSNVATLSVTACGGGAPQQLIQSPGFEGTNAGVWFTSTTQSTDYILDPTNDPANAHAGSRYAWLCGWAATTTESIYQTVTIPAGATTANLGFWLLIASAETGAVANDTLKVQIRNTSGGLIETLATYSNLQEADYALKTFNLLSYAGQTIRIHFEGQENATLYTSFLLDDITLDVTSGSAGTAPAITTQPASQAASIGGSATFTVAASGTATLTYQWRRNGVGIPGATGTSLTVSGLQASDNGAVFDCQVGNCSGVATSSQATLTVSAIAVTVSPKPVTLLPGGQAVLTAVVTGTGNTAVTWSGTGAGFLSSLSANSTTFTASTAGSYVVTATSAADPSKSDSAAVTVKTRDLNGDSTTDVLDLASFARAHGSTSASSNWNAACDLDGDGDVDDTDIALFLAGF